MGLGLIDKIPTGVSLGELNQQITAWHKAATTCIVFSDVPTGATLSSPQNVSRRYLSNILRKGLAGFVV